MSLNARALREQADRDAATPKAMWLATHAPHGDVESRETGVGGRRQVQTLLVCGGCGATYAERSA